MSSKKKSNKRRRPPAGPSRPAGAKPSSAKPAAAGQARTGTATEGATTVKPQRERTGPTRAERLAAAEAARRRRALRNRALLAAALAAVLVGVTLVVVNNRREETRITRQLEAGGCEVDSKADADAGSTQSRNHVPAPTYKVNPPAGGNHLATPAGAGVYTVTNAPPEGQVVHSMEHGYVILWHVPELAADRAEELRTLANKYDRDVLMVPRAGMPVPVAATAWHRRLLCGGSSDMAALEKFIVDFRNKGPEKVAH